MDTSRRFDSKGGAELWLEREGIAGPPALLRTYTDDRGWVVRFQPKATAPLLADTTCALTLVLINRYLLGNLNKISPWKLPFGPGSSPKSSIPPPLYTGSTMTAWYRRS